MTTLTLNLKRNKLGFHYSPTGEIFGVMDDFGFIHDLSDDEFDAALYFFLGF